jgi:methionine aminotransferase
VYHCTGWKLGYCMASEPLMKEFRKIHQFNAFSCDTPKQVALAGFLQKRESYTELGKFLQQKRDYFQRGMQQTRLTPLPTHGSYFQVYSYKNISADTEKDFAIYLTKEYGVATIPVAAFYREEVNQQVLRFCFCKKEETLDTAIERLSRL